MVRLQPTNDYNESYIHSTGYHFGFIIPMCCNFFQPKLVLLILSGFYVASNMTDPLCHHACLLSTSGSSSTTYPSVKNECTILSPSGLMANSGIRRKSSRLLKHTEHYVKVHHHNLHIMMAPFHVMLICISSYMYLCIGHIN